jgi:uncharacterized membrane protein YcaP (DUF421 family)
MTFFNFVSGITIGTIGGTVVLNPNLSIIDGLYALAGWSLITVIMGFIDLKSKTARQLIEGQPIIVVKDGQIMEDQLRKTRLDVNTLNAMLRQKNAFSIADVEYAIFETNGKLSVMKKENKKPLTKGDLNIQTQKQTIYPLSTEVISDGKINQNNLNKLNLNKEWVLAQLNQKGITSVEDVFYAEIKQDGSLYIDNRNDTVH